MRIGFVTPGYVTEKNFSGGISNYVHRVAKALVSLKHEIHVVTISEVDQAQFEHEGVIVHRVKVDRLQQRLNQLSRYRLPSTTKWLSFSVGAYRQLAELHQQHPFDLLQYPNSRACGLVSSLLLPVPYVIRISCYRPAWNQWEDRRNVDTKAIEWLEERQIKISAHVYGPSYTLKRILEKEAKLSKMRIIRTPIYLEAGAWDDSIYDQHLKGKSYLLFFGRYKLLKGFHILAQALPKVLENHQGLQAVFVGRDSGSTLAASMKEYALSVCSQYSERLIFMDQLPHTQLYPIISKARLVVLPSLLDNLPNACMESMALGKPVMGTIGASFDELITDQVNGFLVPADDVEALAAKINEVWQRPDLEEIGGAAKHKAEELSPERTVQQLLQYYEEIISSNQR